MEHSTLISKKITKLNYNTYDIATKKDKIVENLQVNLEAKIGSNKTNTSYRILLFELTIEGVSEEDPNIFTRDLNLEITFHYLVNHKSNNSLENIITHELLVNSVEEINNIIICITSLDNNNPLNLNSELERIKKDKP